MRVLLLGMVGLLSQISDLLHQKTLFVYKLLVVCENVLVGGMFDHLHRG